MSFRSLLLVCFLLSMIYSCKESQAKEQKMNKIKSIVTKNLKEKSKLIIWDEVANTLQISDEKLGKIKLLEKQRSEQKQNIVNKAFTDQKERIYKMDLSIDAEIRYILQDDSQYLKYKKIVDK